MCQSISGDKAIHSSALIEAIAWKKREDDDGDGRDKDDIDDSHNNS